MKKLLTIKGVFNDFFTGYVDKESSVSVIVDDELDCTCGYQRCIIHDMPKDSYILSDVALPPRQVTTDSAGGEE